MSKYFIRLDDASEFMDIERWNKIENILDSFLIKPIVSIIPNNKDNTFINKYPYNEKFWDKAREWEKKGWVVSMHGYTHVYETTNGGINPVNNRSEFAGLTLERQAQKMVNGYEILVNNGLTPKIFNAPSHTFDIKTIEALYQYTPIRIISDTIASNTYFYNNIYFIPQQVGQVRFIPLKIVTFCYHPNLMCERDFTELEIFLKKHHKKFIFTIEEILLKRSLTKVDKVLRKVYFIYKKYRRKI